jgi:hypothetical protein
LALDKHTKNKSFLQNFLLQSTSGLRHRNQMA